MHQEKTEERVEAAKGNTVNPAAAREPRWAASRKDLYTVAMVIVLGCGIQWWIMPEMPAYCADSISYVGGAQSLASGNGYRWPLVVGQPAIGIYPPLQSLVLAVAWLLRPGFPDVYALLNAEMLILWGATLLAMFAVLRRGGLSGTAAALITLTVGTNGGISYFISHCYSDILFAVLGLAAGWLWVDPKPVRFVPRMAAAGVLLALMYLTRTAALGFLPGALVAVAFACRERRCWRAAAAFVLPVALAVGLWALAPKETVTYSQWLAEQYQRHGGPAGLIEYTAQQSWLYVNGHHWANCFYYDGESEMRKRLGVSPAMMGTILGLFTAARIGGLAVCGYGAFKAREHRGLQAATGTYLLLVLAWPFPLGCRVLLPVMPLILLWGFRGAKALPKLGTRICQLGGLGFVGLCLGFNLWDLGGFHRRDAEIVALPPVEATGQWIKKNLPAEARIVGDFEEPMLQMFAKSEHPIHCVESTKTALLAPDLPYDYAVVGLDVWQSITNLNPKQTRLQEIWTCPYDWFRVLKIHPPTAVREELPPGF